MSLWICPVHGTSNSPTCCGEASSRVHQVEHFTSCQHCGSLTSLAHLQSAVRSCPGCGFAIPPKENHMSKDYTNIDNLPIPGLSANALQELSNAGENDLSKRKVVDPVSLPLPVTP